MSHTLRTLSNLPMTYHNRSSSGLLSSQTRTRKDLPTRSSKSVNITEHVNNLSPSIRQVVLFCGIVFLFFLSLRILTIDDTVLTTAAMRRLRATSPAHGPTRFHSYIKTSDIKSNINNIFPSQVQILIRSSNKKPPSNNIPQQRPNQGLPNVLANPKLGSTAHPHGNEKHISNNMIQSQRHKSSRRPPKRHNLRNDLPRTD